MDRFRQINNSFIGPSDHLEYTRVLTPNQNVGGGTLLGRKFIVDLPNQDEKLAQITCRVTLTSAGDNSSIYAYLGLRIFSYMCLRTKKTKQIIAQQYPETAYFRMEELQNTKLYDTLSRAVEPSATLNNAVTTDVFVPFFAWFSEPSDTEDGHSLATRQMEDLELYCEVADSNDEIGLPAGVSALEYQFYCDYVEPRVEKKLYPQKLIGYDYFREDVIPITSVQTQATIFLKCPDPTYLVALQLRTSSHENFGIDRVRMYTGSELVFDKYFNSNYKMYNRNHLGSSDNSPFINLFARTLMRDRNQDQKDYLIFSTEMKPTKLVVDFTATGEACNLYCHQETLKHLEVDDIGRVDSQLLGNFMDNKNFN